MSITYRIALEIPGEPREAPATFADFDRGIAACVAYARQHPGVAVRLFVQVSDSKLFDHHYTVFEVKIPGAGPVHEGGDTAPVRRGAADLSRPAAGRRPAVGPRTISSTLRTVPGGREVEA